MMENSRIAWIDIAKGLGIFLMVCGHTSIPDYLSNYIWSFHMPLFFIISGMLYNPNKLRNGFGVFFKKKFKTLVIPYLFFLGCDIVYRLKYDTINIDMFLKGKIESAYWFIQVLLLVEIINALLIKYTGKLYIYCLVFLSLMGYWAYIYNFHLPYRIEVVGLASLHYGMGYMLGGEIYKINTNLFYSVLLCFLSFIVSLFIPRLDMNINQYGSYLPNILAAWIGTISFICLSKNIELLSDKSIIKRFFIFAGYNSIVIMGLSIPINMIIKHFLKNILIIRDLSFVSSIVQHIMLWIFLYYISIILNKYTPILIGRHRI